MSLPLAVERERGVAGGWSGFLWSQCFGSCIFSLNEESTEESVCCLVVTIWIYSLEGWELERIREILWTSLSVGFLVNCLIKRADVPLDCFGGLF